MALTPTPPGGPTRPTGRTRVRLAAGLLTALALAATATIAPVGAQAAPGPSDRAGLAATWLAGQLVDGERLETSFGGDSFPDYGLTADAVLALAAAAVADPQAAAATSWLVANTTAYVGDGTDAVWAGATAKLALVAQVRGLDPTSWGSGGVDLIDRILAREQADGRFTDLSEFGDFSNPITQSLAIVVLARQPGVAPSDAAIDRLLAIRCGDGGLAASLDADPATCTSGVDGTAFAVQALIAAGRPGDAGAVAGALDFLEAVQHDGGGLGTSAGASPNANSTGVAAQALAAGGRTGAATAARSFLASLQLGCDADPDDRGAIAFDPSGFDPSNAARATTQAMPGLVGVPLGALSAAGASSALPAFECPTTPADPPPGGEPGPSGPGAGPIGTTPPARPVVASPTYTG